jgi:hypothetical protein
MKQVICESPVIIRNSHLKRLLLSNGCYHTPAGYVRISEAEKFVYYHNFPKHRFSPKKLGAQIDVMKSEARKNNAQAGGQEITNETLGQINQATFYKIVSESAYTYRTQ